MVLEHHLVFPAKYRKAVFEKIDEVFKDIYLTSLVFRSYLMS